MKNPLSLKQLLLISTMPLFLSTAFASSDRWYTPQQANKGEQVFKNNCASCHGKNAEATPNWKKTDANGKYPPPPLNGSAHAWHHDLKLLRQTVREGGKALGGTMPPFQNVLNAEQIDQAISYFQSKWPDDTYNKWAGRFESNETKLPSLTDIVNAQQNSITQHLEKRTGVKQFNVEKTELEGVWRTQLGSQYVYLLNGGKHAVIGEFFNLENGQNLTEIERRKTVKKALAQFNDEDLIIYEPEGKIKTTLDIFTDTSCPYCRKLHKELPDLLDAGIKVRYFPFPRGFTNGPGYQTLRSVWCAKDRTKAMDDAKNQMISDLPKGDCKAANMVDTGYTLGNQIGVGGTPALFTESGKKIEGYVPAKKLIPMVLNER